MKIIYLNFLIPILIGCKTQNTFLQNENEPSGTIAFVSGRDGNAEIYTINSDGTGQEI
jgi:hypothetical protein